MAWSTSVYQDITPTVDMLNQAISDIEAQSAALQNFDGSAITTQSLTGNGALVIDYTLGRHVLLTMTGNVTSINIINWPATTTFARLTCEIHNTGAFTLSGYPAGWKISNGHTVPVLTPGAGAEDWIAFTTHTAGTTVSVHWVGQNYS